MTVRPWKKVGTRSLCDCRVFQVRADRYQHPDTGEEHDFFLLNCSDWVNVIALTDDGELLLVRQHRFGTDEASLEIPGGMVDPGESSLEAAARELLEETGYAARELVPLGAIRPNPAIQGNTTFSFLARGCRKVAEAKTDSTEEIELVRVPIEQVDALLREGRISHALVAVAFLHWKLLGSPR